MQKYRLIEGFIGELPCIKVINANNIVVDIVFKRSATFDRDMEDVIAKYKIDID